MDAFAVTVANSSCPCESLKKEKRILMPVLFSLFQFLMPVIGFYIGSLIIALIKDVAEYLSAGIFLALAIKITIDNVKRRKEVCDKNSKTKKLSFWVLLLQALATSIDALIVGFTFNADGIFHPFFASLIIGIVTFAIVCLGVFFGKLLGKTTGNFTCWIGAIILYALAIKNLVYAII